VAGGWWLVAGGWWLVAGGWWLVAGGWQLAAGGWQLAAGSWRRRRRRRRRRGSLLFLWKQKNSVVLWLVGEDGGGRAGSLSIHLRKETCLGIGTRRLSKENYLNPKYPFVQNISARSSCFKTNRKSHILEGIDKTLCPNLDCVRWIILLSCSTNHVRPSCEHRIQWQSRT
jgi:hypothetical protein